MKVLMISLERGLFEDGQVRRRIVEQNQSLEQLTILVFGKQGFDQMVAPNIRVVSTASWFRLLYILDAMQRLWFWRKEKFDVITTDTVETAIVGVMAARMFSAALAIQDHGYYFHGDYYRKESFLNRFLYLFMRWAVRRADAVRVVSVRTEKALIDLGIPSGKIVRFPLALNSPRPALTSGQPSLEIREGSGEDDSPRVRYFFMAARFVPIKRIDLAIHAFSLIAARHPDIKLKIVGRGKVDVARKVKEFGMESRVEILPWTDKLQDLYHGALATLITSDREGFNMTAVESLLCGTPVIMTDVGCAGEVVKDGVNGYVVPVGDVDALADRMELSLTDKALRGNARSYVWQPTGLGMEDFLNKAVENYGKPKQYS
ncbi:MAG: glycosyltransferase family 4 protein [Patescibacteria group bacterium]|nr:glycosyltransferase family 4 protein [Patescibacteria group bacterium]